MSSIDQLLTGDRTRADAVLPRVLERPTRTSQDELAEQAGVLRNATRFLAKDVADVHDRALDVQLAARTDEAAKRAVPDLLHELAEMGFAWRDIARLVGVTVPAVRKWRQGETASGGNRRAVAQLLAFVDVLRAAHLVQDVPSWMDIPLAASTITGLDLYAAGGAKLLLLQAAGHLTSEQVLDQLNPLWRDDLDGRFEIVTASDGDPLVRLHQPEQPG
ncbi:MAG: hypothetical protein LC808_11975 [Actinobacteria bacterium]|nr:hypothetical protein [Actinomycetota bacterium]